MGLMTAAEIQQWVLRSLGAPLLQVELVQDHLDDAIEQARRWFSAKKGVRKLRPMPIFSGIPDYQLPDDVDLVLDVAFPVNPMDISLIFSPYILQDEKIPYDVFAAPSSIGIYSSYTQTIQYIEVAKRILNAEPDWRQEDRTLYLFPVPKGSGNVILEYKSHEFTIEQLRERDHDMLKRYALAYSKRILGRVRSKYGEFPGAQGNVPIDGERLLAEAKEELEALDKELFGSQMPTGFLVG